MVQLLLGLTVIVFYIQYSGNFEHNKNFQTYLNDNIVKKQ